MITAITFDDISPIYINPSKLKWLIEFLNDLGVMCTFFVVPHNFTSQWPEEFVENLKYALDTRHELALHGYMHIKNEFGIFYPIPLPIPYPTFKKQKNLIERGRDKILELVGVKPEGFRAPYYLHNSNTGRALAALGFEYDSSATIFKPTHCSRFRIRVLRNARPVLTSCIIEIPVVGDYTYNLRSYGFLNAYKMAIRDFELMESLGGIFVVNNHPNLFGSMEFQFLKKLLEKIGERSEFMRLIDVAKKCSINLARNC